MKKAMLLLVCFALLISLGVAFGADKLAAQTNQGDKALLFTINGLGDFGIGGAPAGMLVYETDGSADFETYSGIGFKTFLSDGIALRIGLGYSSGSVTTKTDAGDEINSLSLMSIQPAIEYHLYQAEAVSIYTGAGISYTKYSMSSDVPDTDKITYSISGLGFAGLLGAEFYPWKNVSFGAEYQLGYASGSSKADNGTDNTDGPKASMIGIQTIGVTLGIHFK
jgi:opacity protein-like surface antigen